MDVKAKEEGQTIEAWKQLEGRDINDEFYLRKYLGDSEQCAVFLAERASRDGVEEPQQVAIKLLPADQANAELQLSRWQLAQSLSHPHLIRLLQAGRCRLGGMEMFFAVMELAEENLAQVIPDRALTPDEVRDVLQPTLDVLAYLHTQGFVHTRLRPANVMAVREQMKLASDCVCRAGESLPNLGKDNVYDPPEKASGAASSAADIWSLGMMLAEISTQRLPSRKENDQADPILPENLPASLFDIVRGCLRRNPQRRWTIAEISARLHPAPLSRPKRVTDGPREGFTGRRFVVPLIVALLVVTAIFAASRLLRRQPEVRQDILAVKPGQKPEAEESRAKPSPISPSSAARPAAAHPAAANRGPADDQVANQVLPDVPQKARDTIHGTLRVSVRVHVDRSGSVVGAELESPGPSKYFAGLAMQAAQSWKFTPASKDAGRDFILSFDFTNTETKAYATRAAP